MKTKTLIYLQSIIILILIFLLFKSCNGNNSSCSSLDFENSPNKISAATANEMEELYKANQYSLINNEYGIVDHREYWFPLKELKSYLCYIEDSADKLNYDKSTLGIRVYNAAKMKSKTIKSSIFMIGTYKSQVQNQSSSRSSTLTENENFDSTISAFNYGQSGKEPKGTGAKEFNSN